MYISMKGRGIMGEEMQCTRKDVQAIEVNRCIADQSNMHPNKNLLDIILTPNTDFDNDEIYDTRTRETIRGLDDVSY